MVARKRNKGLKSRQWDEIRELTERMPRHSFILRERVIDLDNKEEVTNLINHLRVTVALLEGYLTENQNQLISDHSEESTPTEEQVP